MYHVTPVDANCSSAGKGLRCWSMLDKRCLPSTIVRILSGQHSSVSSRQRSTLRTQRRKIASFLRVSHNPTTQTEMDRACRFVLASLLCDVLGEMTTAQVRVGT